ncbi:MAG: site-specific integrase [Rhodoferax sp.]|uniref:tyrosine-type recombinase/integrase n=1 Tax=Rhodoferax sp. TaxID=50421 RepID=UPI00271F86C3|nr:site-specific integrase [Rhodoferax sp.]MDO8450362.1 site-specific integrase [Rhodoferax sp.]
MAKAYKEGIGWAMRQHYKGNDIYKCGYELKEQVEKAVRDCLTVIDRNLRPAGLGADKTTVAQALQDYAVERLPFMKGAVQEARRMNHYLRYAGLDTLVATAIKAPSDAPDEKTKSGEGAYFEVTLAPHTTERKVANGLHKHRRNQLTQNANTEKYRAVIATTPMSEVSRKLLQDFVLAMQRDKNAASTIALERSMLRVLFKHAFSQWTWADLHDNPATKLKLPQVNNTRKRVVSEEEKSLLDASIEDCRNSLVGPVISLLRETAMRASEPLEKAHWRDVNWERCVLILHDPKEGGEGEVPLSPAALQALRDLGPGAPDEPIVKITYESLRASWNRACKRAGIKNLNMHDLRRTAATQMALKTGNVFLVQALTRHKTLAMVHRYVQVGADDVVKVLHAPTPPAQSAPTPVQAAALEPAVACVAPALFTQEQMEAMAKLAAQAAIAGLVQAQSQRQSNPDVQDQPCVPALASRQELPSDSEPDPDRGPGNVLQLARRSVASEGSGSLLSAQG